MAELLGALLSSGVQKDSHPILKRKELPDLHGPILGTAPMFIDKMANGFRPEQAALINIGIGKQIIDHFF